MGANDRSLISAPRGKTTANALGDELRHWKTQSAPCLCQARQNHERLNLNQVFSYSHQIMTRPNITSRALGIAAFLSADSTARFLLPFRAS